ncbi:Rossmann-like and DUF2520 domain-containing protein, partial [Chloroflexota bacterium]
NYCALFGCVREGFLLTAKMSTIGFIGVGTVGTALAVLFSRNGYAVTTVSSRSKTSAEKFVQRITGCQVAANNQQAADHADIIFITTPDDVIATIASEVNWRAGQSVVHCSGAASTDILEPARKAGAQVGSMHPLQTLAGVEQAITNIPGTTFAIEAEEPLLTTLKGIAEALGGTHIELKASDKVLYHAAAVIACNYLVTLVKLATDLWQTFSVPPEQATRALLPLIQGTLNNVANIGVPNCLTGPIARGDTGTIKKHIESLQKTAPEILPAYKELGRQTIPISLAKGKINARQAKELESILA